MSQTVEHISYNTATNHSEYIIIVAKEGSTLPCASLMGYAFLSPLFASAFYAAANHSLSEKA